MASNHRISRYTSIGRPLNLRGAADRAVVAISAASFLLGAALALRDGLAASVSLLQGLVYLLTVFGAWALAREFDPDDPSAAFIGMAAAIAAAMAVATPGLLLAYATLGLMRIVNRSSGLAARKSDSMFVMALCIGVIYLAECPFFGLVAALAFILDGTLKEPLRHQWVFAFVGIGASIVYMVDHDVGLGYFTMPASLFEWIGLLFVLILALDALLLGTVRSKGDFTGRTLDSARVRGAMAVGLAAALQGLNRPAQVVIVVAAIAAVCVGMALRKGFRSPATG